MLRLLVAVRHGGGDAPAMLGPGERVLEVEYDKAKVVVYAAVAVVGSRDRNGSSGRSSSSAMLVGRACMASGREGAQGEASRMERREASARARPVHIRSVRWRTCKRARTPRGVACLRPVCHEHVQAQQANTTTKLRLKL